MGKPGEQRRQEIVEATLELAAERGVKQVTTQAIADRVQIAQPTIFRHFKSRDAIFSAAIGFIAERLFDALGGLFEGPQNADERLRLLIARQLSFVSSHRGLPRILFSDRLHLESPQLKKAVQQVMSRYVGKIAEIIRQGVESGHFRKGLDPEQTATYIAALIQGLIMRWSIFDFSFPLEAEGERLWRFLEPVLREN